MKIKSGWLTLAKHIQTPNKDERPVNSPISLIVIHCISLPPGKFGGHAIDQLFTNQLDPLEHPYFESIHTLKVSAHTLIQRDGLITQYLPFHQRAWHAGRSCYQKKTHCNDFSIGIELEGTETTLYTDKQYQSLTALIHLLIQTYPTLSYQHITGHSDIAPGRKQDPGPYFDWAKLKYLLSKTHADYNDSMLD